MKLRSYNKIKTPTLIQMTDTECGVTALAILFAYYKCPVSIETLRDACGAVRDGSKATTLLKVAREHGFIANAYRVDLDFLDSLREPVIAYWNFCHYVVIQGRDKKRVFINDPACGQRWVSLDEFDRSFTGVILTLTPGKNCVLNRSRRKFRELFRDGRLRFNKKTVFLSLCAMICFLSPLLHSVLSMILVDQVLISGKMQWLPWMTLILLSGGLLFASLAAFQKWHHHALSATAGTVQFSHLIHHILTLPMLYFSLRHKGEILTIVNGIETVIQRLTKTGVVCLSGGVSVLMCFLLMAWIDKFLLVSTLLCSLVSCGVTLQLARRNFVNEKSSTQTQGKLHAHSLSSLRSLETIRATGMEVSVLQRWCRLFCNKLNQGDVTHVTNSLMVVSETFFNRLSSITLLSVGAWRMTTGTLTPGRWMAFYMLHFFCSGILNSVLSAVRERQGALASRSRLSDLLNYAPDRRFQIWDSEEPKRLSVSPVLTCENVNFYFNINSPPVLSQINLEILPGQHVALVGPTGSGKSTLASVLCGLLPVHSGTLRLSGEDVSCLSPARLSRIFARVSQDISLFEGTLYDNLVLFQAAPSQAALAKAIQVACLSDLIKERGLDAPVQEGSAHFSGGERQRIAIARALLQDTPILVLDEATSALDNVTQKALVTQLRKLSKTVIFVAHRLSSIRHCDQIIVLEEGRIVGG